MTGLRPAAVGATGLAAAGVVAAVLGMPARDAAELITISFGTALVALGLAYLPLQLRARTVLVALVPVVAVGAGALAAARKMFVSAHDLDALVVIVVGAGTVGVLGASRLARDLERANRRVAAAAERERMMERSRRELVAWVSHDLRTPLSGIRAMVEALADGVVADPDTVHQYHHVLIEETDRLARLVDDLFELSRIQADALQLAIERVSLGEVVSDAVAAAVAVAEARGVRVETSVDGGAPEVLVSTPEMLRVVRNLLDNAVRHTPSGGAVRVEVTGDIRHGVLSVSDECGGIPTPDLDRVFDVAYRGDVARSSQVDAGGGLGLAIARGLVEAHAGEISVRNESGGCRFTVRLPLASS